MSARHASNVVWRSSGVWTNRQQVVFPSSVDIDVIGFYREETISAACVFVVREGRTVRTCEFILDKGLDVDEEELQSGFLKRYYDETADIQLRSTFPSSLRMRSAGGMACGQVRAFLPSP